MTQRRPRRKRFTVILSRSQKEVILADDSRQAADHYTSKGLTVLEVREGDYRQRDATPSGARPCFLSIRKASAMLGLRLPVEVKLSGRKSFNLGGYIPVPTDPSIRISGGKARGPLDTAPIGFRHQIEVKSWLTAEEMGECLWHELTHAQQFEREALPLGISVRNILKAWHTDYHDGTGYSQKRQEREACANMKNNSTIPLAR